MTHRFALASLPTALLVSALAGCSGSPPPEAEAAAIDSAAALAPPADKPAADKPAADKPAAKKDEGSGLTEDQKAQMEIALRRGGDKAQNCASVVPDGPRGEGEVKVTFDGKKGRSTDAVVGPPFAGTPMEACIKRSFIGEIIVPFDGELEVPYTVKLAPKAGDAPKGKATPPAPKKK